MPDISFVAKADQALSDQSRIVFLLDGRLVVDQLVNLSEVIGIDLVVFVTVVQSKNILVFGLQLGVDMKGGEEVEKKFKVDPFGLDLPHFLLKNVPNPRKQSMLPQVLNILKILDFQRLHIFLIQLCKQLFEILHFLQSVRVNITNFIFLQLTPIDIPLTDITGFF